MYRNFKLTDLERKEILERHKKYGYGKSLNEQIEENSDEQNENEMIDGGDVDMENKFMNLLNNLGGLESLKSIKSE